jgi:hypothetical protein
VTTDQIVTLADPSNLASPELNLNALLRFKIIPEFLSAVRGVSWRRKYTSQNISAGVSTYDMVANLESIFDARLDGDKEPLPYIGEHTQRIFASMSGSTPKKPTGWWLELNATSGLRVLHLDSSPDTSYVLRIAYLWGYQFQNDSDSVQLNTLMPERVQWALVSGLKRELQLERFGQQDPRFVVAAKEFEEAKTNARLYREEGPGGVTIKTIS